MYKYIIILSVVIVFYSCKKNKDPYGALSMGDDGMVYKSPPFDINERDSCESDSDCKLSMLSFGDCCDYPCDEKVYNKKYLEFLEKNRNKYCTKNVIVQNTNVFLEITKHSQDV